ncbi:peptidase C60B [[Clostridium] sordellii]|uniref:class B sortase n=1 Tax=Paraclostridium sordellii TaxID=1505 RepID=UPI0005DBF5FF|nr:class B sortase [Paeniclostridium sordellii]CEQ29811.1 peptidase C60B [[Clostridium] sordellii] [Paeniclostridium sordellii]
MKFVRRIVELILCLIVLFCIFQIGYKQFSYYENDKENKEIQKIVKDNENIENIDNKLKEINNEYKLWINIPNTKINYPVVQTNNNEYYLNHSFKKENNSGGALFIYDKYNLKNSKNLIIFGHNMRNDSMFGTLSLFKNKEFFKENSFINIIIGDYVYIYKVFGVSTMKADDFDINDNFKNKKDLDDYLSNLKKHSDNWENKDITMDTNLLTLYTCTYEFDDARLILTSELVKKVKLTESYIKNINENMN